jgi:transposase
MTDDTTETAQMRSITIEIPVIVAQKMAETFEGTLEDATLAGLKLLHGMGIPAYTKLQALAKRREISTSKAIRTAVDLLESDMTKANHGVNPIGRPKINEARDTAIYTQVTNGYTYAEVASAFQISLVRVGQIVAQQRATRGVTPRGSIAARNADVIRRVDAGEDRKAVAASYNVSRGVVDNIMAAHRAANPKAIPEMPPKQEEVLSLKASEAQPEQTEQPEQPAKPRFVLPGLRNSSTPAAPVDTRTAKERDVFDPEFGF